MPKTQRANRTRLEQIAPIPPVFPLYAVSNRYNNFAVKLTSDGWARGAFPPYNSIQNFDIAIEPKPERTKYAIEPFWVERSYEWDNGLEGKSRWFASPTSAFSAVLFEFHNRGKAAITLIFGENGLFRVGHPRGDETTCTYATETGPEASGIRVANAQFPDLFCRVQGNFPGKIEMSDRLSGKNIDPGKTAFLRYQRHSEIAIKPGKRITLWLAITGGRTGFLEFPFEPTTKSIRAEFRALQRWQKKKIAQSPSLETPNEEINALFAWSILFPWHTEHDLPVGKPYDMASRDNALLRVLSPTTTISYDYYGMWANDCIETFVEYGCLGKSFNPVMANSLESFFQHGIPESVECPFDTGLLYKNPGDFGQKGEWLNAAAYYLLWTADKEGFERLWPQMQQVMAEFRDKRDTDHDWLDDTITSESFKVSMPEQLPLKEFNHELLYQNCFWYAGFQASACVARLFGDAVEADKLTSQSTKIKEAINAKFTTDYGYASWLDKNHRPHPHKGHNQMFALLYGIASPDQARKVFETELAPPILTPYGPRVADIPCGGTPVYETCAWVFNRWGMIQCLFQYGQADPALELADQWARQEASSICHYQGPEFFAAEGGQPGLGLVWSAGRVVRSMLFGLVGLRLEGDGIRFEPSLPSAWPGMQMKNLYARGAMLDVEILRCKEGKEGFVKFDGRKMKDGLIPNDLLANGKRHKVKIAVGSDGR